MYTFYSLLFLASLLKNTTGASWCYESQVSCEHKCNGPSKWADIAPTCGGRKQSPINIITRKVRFEGSLPLFGFPGYQETFHSVIMNNGHTVKVNLSGTAQITGGNLSSTYKAIEIHFHWGKNGGPGSEHTIDGEQFPMEPESEKAQLALLSLDGQMVRPHLITISVMQMHIVHIKDKYSSVEEAVEDPSGLAVLGFLYQEAHNPNKKYDPIINALASIKLPDNSTALQSLSLESLIPSHSMLTGYFRYEGSLTTPSCAESVVWTVFTETIPLSKEQLSAFSRLQFDNATAMVGTFRPVQPLNGREVFYSGSAAAASVNTVLLISTILTTYLTLTQ